MGLFWELQGEVFFKKKKKLFKDFFFFINVTPRGLFSCSG